jgi:chorismate mutase-like protein
VAERRGSMTIEDWRAKIDELDQRLLKLLSERAEYVLAVGKIKSQRNMEVFDPEREREIIRSILHENRGPLDEDALRRIFQCVIDECRRIENK